MTDILALLIVAYSTNCGTSGSWANGDHEDSCQVYQAISCNHSCPDGVKVCFTITNQYATYSVKYDAGGNVIHATCLTLVPPPAPAPVPPEVHNHPFPTPAHPEPVPPGMPPLPAPQSIKPRAQRTSGLRASAIEAGPLLSISCVAVADSTNHQVRIDFPTQLGLLYTVQYTDELSGGGWTNTPVELSGNGSVMSFYGELVDQPDPYYRVLVTAEWVNSPLARPSH